MKISPLLLVLVMVSLASCSSASSQTPPAPQPGTTPAAQPAVLRNAPPAVDTSTRLSDANGKILGYVTSSSPSSLDLYTPKGYFVSIDWNGTLLEGIALFTGADGTGTMFFQWTRESALRGFVASIHGHPYVASSLDGNGFAVADPGITSYESYSFNDSITNVPATPVLGPYNAYPLKQAQPADIGLPSSVALPLRIVSQ
jgi:hypothetical protein